MMETSRSGKTLKKIGIAAIFTGYLLGMAVELFGKDSDGLVSPIFILPPLLLIIGGTFLFFRGRQYAAKNIAERVLSGTKSQVLYLRAFKADTSPLEQVYIAAKGILGALTTTVEEQLVEVLEQIGSVVAIGQPGESLPKPGAVRLYASDDEWKEVVTDRMKASQLVVIRAGTGKGLLWELQQAVEMVNPKKLLILVLHMKKRQYESFRKDASTAMAVPLPETRAISRFWRVSGLIRFSDDWKPDFLRLRAPFFRTGIHKPHRQAFTFTFKPVLEDFGLEWRKPSVSWLTISAIGIPAILSAISILLSIYVVYEANQEFPGLGWIIVQIVSKIILIAVIISIVIVLILLVPVLLIYLIYRTYRKAREQNT